ncbi:response regulator [Paraburkholderia edwinii]|jgi:two-component system KDP operon response regulator KdpE|uniref:Response regulator n=1 Tax=Paraburkholderia edwinii TaxID=2861782 RepID=A0ABX8UGN7_9BURK|nr:response regulator [Paraburkholderia edwinii]QYD67979.1 response regulator [Paraburkholderia edwinii]
MEPAVNVVLIEDDKYLRRMLRTALENETLRITGVETGRQGITAAASMRPDILIVDLGLPDMDGLEVIRELRAWSSIPIVVLSARRREEDKIAALDAGADDYVEKPFSIAELAARIRVQLRRLNPSVTADSRRIRFGDVAVDLETRTVERNGLPVHLTPIEFRLLIALARRAGSVLTHRQLLIEVWGPGRASNLHYLRIYMAHLRQKLERDPAQPEYMLTETAVGYRLVGVT